MQLRPYIYVKFWRQKERVAKEARSWQSWCKSLKYIGQILAPKTGLAEEGGKGGNDAGQATLPLGSNAAWRATLPLGSNATGQSSAKKFENMQKC